MVGPSGADERQRALETLALLAGACLVLGFMFHVRIFTYTAVALLVIALFVKPLAAKLSSAWLGLSAVLGAVNSKILLTLVFYLVLTPIAVVHRYVHGDFLSIRGGGARESHWTERNQEYTARDLERPW